MWLGSNSLNGSIPSVIQWPSSLKYLGLYNNELDGNVPTQLNCQNLMLLNLASNRLHGQLPKELGNLSQLVALNLQDNNFRGEIPDEFSMLVSLTTLNLGQNYLGGGIPPAIVSLRSILFLNLEGNELTGPILDTTDTLLIEFMVGSNKLNGTIPEMSLTLTTVNLSNNLLYGFIPSQLGNLSHLEVLDLSNNELTGEVPSSLTQLQNLELLVLSDNQLSETLPQFGYWVKVNITGNKDMLEMSMRTVGKFDVLILISTFVSGFIASFSLAILVQQICSSCRENNQTGRSTSRHEPLSSVDEL